MTNELETAGRLVAEYATTKRRLGALVAEARQMRVLLDIVSASLAPSHPEWDVTIDGDRVRATRPYQSSDAVEGQWPSGAALGTLKREMRATREQLADVAAHLLALGVPVSE